MPSAMQEVVVCALLLIQTLAVKPPGYVEPKKDADTDSPKYEYGYQISNEHGGEQGKQEQRDGIHASGRYFVQGKESNQEVRYFADDWGYHPVVEYSSVGPYSRSSATFALDHEAVVQLKNKENNQPQLQGLPDTGNLDIQGSRVSLEKLAESTGQAQVDFQATSTYQPTRTQNFQADTRPQEIPKKPQEISEQPQQGFQSIQENKVLQFPQQKENTKTSKEDQQLTNFSPQQYIQQQPEAQPLIQLIPTQGDSLNQGNSVQPLNVHGQEHFEQVKEHVENLIYPHEQVQVSNGESQFVQFQETSVLKKNVENQAHSETASQSYDSTIIQPQKLVQLEDFTNEYNGGNTFSEFGLKIDAVKKDGSNKLVESTQHLVSGQDVLDINSAIIDHQQSDLKINSQASDSEYKTSDVTSVSTTTPANLKESNFKDQPIVVADSFESDVWSSTANVELNQEQETYSTTAKDITEISSTVSPFQSTVFVTPRPVSTKFLAPITAGIRLQNVEQHSEEQKQENKQNVRVEIQESIPYYLGKYEYPLGYGQQVTVNQSATLSIDENAKENIQLGNTLLYFPGQDISFEKQAITDVNNHITIQQLPRIAINEQFQETDQQQAQGYQNQVTVGYTAYVTPATKEVAKIIHKPYPVEVPYPIVKQVEIPKTIHKVIEKPVHITKYVEKPVRVPQPFPVEKVIEKPVHIPVQVTKYIDRPYPVEVRVPYPQPYPVDTVVQKIVKQPYPVEVRVPVPVDRIVEKKVPHYIEKPVPVEKIVEKPVAHYIDRPYPVEKIVEKPVTKFVEKPYPVEKIVEKPVPHYVDRPYPVEVKVPVEKIVEKKVPHYVDRPYPVEKIVEKPVPYYIDRPYPVERIVEKPVPHYVDRPYPVEVRVPVEKIVEKKVPHYVVRPYPVEKIVEKPVPHYVDRPYPVEVKVPVPQPYYVKVEVPKPYGVNLQQPYISQVNSADHVLDQTKYHPREQYVQQSRAKVHIIANPYSYAPQINKYIPPKKQLVVNNGYLPPNQVSTDYLHTFHGNGYLPPNNGKSPAAYSQDCRNYLASYTQSDIGLLPPRVDKGQNHLLRTHRNARSHFDDKNVRMEYGFLPPMIPSMEIDDQGNPIEKGDK